MDTIALQQSNVVNRGYFKKNNDDSLWQTYFEYSNNIFCIAKRTNLTYTEYSLSHKDVDFIIQSLVQLWNNDLDFEVLCKQSKGKILKLSKTYDNVSFSINKITLLSELTVADCRKLYAMLQELVVYKQTNKLSL